MLKRLSVGFIALAAVYVLATGSGGLIGLKYRLIAYGQMAAAHFTSLTEESKQSTDDALSTAAPRLEPEIASADRAIVHLGSLRSEAGAKQEWLDLKEAFPEKLAGAEFGVERVDLAAKGTFYRVLADVAHGPYSAQQLCASLHEVDQYCQVVRSKGVNAPL